jgi:hypothetical protein
MSDEQKPSSPKFDINKLQEQMAIKMQELWNGKIPLFQAFWIYYFSVVLALNLMAASLGFLGNIIAVFAIGWSAFMVKPIWVAADKYAGPKHWSLLAKVAALLILIQAITLLF